VRDEPAESSCFDLLRGLGLFAITVDGRIVH
jgi:hypothetical protein